MKATPSAGSDPHEEIKVRAQGERLGREEEYRSLFESSSDAIMILEPPSWRFTKGNPATVKMFGAKNEEEFVSLGPWEVSPDRQPDGSDSAEKARENIETALREGSASFEWTHRRIGGEEFPTDVLLTRIELGREVVLQATVRDITERKRSERAIRHERDFNQAVVDSLPGLFYVFDEQGRFLRWNRNLSDVSGYSNEEISRMQVLDFFTEPDKRIVAAGMEQGFTTGVAVLESTILAKDQARAPYLFYGKRFQFEGAPCLIGLGIDISERKEAERELRWRTAFLEALVQTSPDGILVVDAKGKKILQNQRTIELWKIPGEVVNNPDDGEQVRFVMDQTVDPKQFVDKVLYLYAHPRETSRDEVALKDGTILERYSAPVLDREGDSYGRIWSFREITESKRAEESVARLATAVEQGAEGIMITDVAGAIEYVNPAFLRISGYTRDEAIGQNPRFLKSGVQDADFYRRMWATLTRGEVWRGRMVNRKKDGTLFEVEASISPVRNRTAQIVNYVAVQRDVSLETQLENQFRQSQKMEAVGQLAGGVAHDFNNILSVIMMQAELTGVVEDLPQRAREGLSQISAAAERAANLTRQLLLFSRKQVMQPRVLDLNEVVTSLAKMLKRVIGEDVRLLLDVHPRPLITRADAGMLDQVLMNLVVNARDAMPGGGQILIDTSERQVTEEEAALIPDGRPGRYVSLRVRDSGRGIEPEHLSRIFEPFFTTKEQGKGTGLGLATVFGIVKQHGGSVAVESEVGRGTTFRILLPAAEAVAPSGPHSLGSEPFGGTETILLVEDESAVRKLTRIVLERRGYRVLAAADGVEALKIWQEHAGEVDLLLTDMVMPEGIGGRELAERLRESRPKLRVIFTSGYSADIAGRELVLEEGQNFLQKPCPPDRILEAVRRCLDG